MGSNVFLVLLLPILLELAGLSFAVWTDQYISRKHRRVMFIIIGLIAALILQNIAGYLLDRDGTRPFARTLVGIFGYSIRPEERGKGYGKEQLRLALIKAREIGLRRVRIICVDTNERSKKTILGNGGVMLDQLRGEESGLTVCRFDVSL